MKQRCEKVHSGQRTERNGKKRRQKMYRVLVVALTGLLLVGLSFSAFAEEKGMVGCDMMKGGMMGKPAMPDSGMAAQGGMMGMCPMMKPPMNPMTMNHTMMNKSLVATADGGVVVLVGN
jgi:hypothetical protein